MKRTNRRGWLYLLACIGLLVVTGGLWWFTGDQVPEDRKARRQRFRETVTRWFPEEAAKVAASFGLRRFGGHAGDLSRRSNGAPSIVLVHGLDDPGKVWMNLAPALAQEGFEIWEMYYPNDQPIVDSARLMGQEMSILKEKGSNQVVIVAHSMGGLVSREMLTRPDIAYLQRVDAGEVPAVAELVLVATPNQGSEIARFRSVGEIRDQWVHFFKGRGHWLRWVLDGAGEAGIDLLPGSRFLTALNARPHPPGTKLSIIAGVISPWEEAQIAQWRDGLLAAGNDAAVAHLDAVREWLKSATEGLGDGLVSLDSTRLAGVPHRTVFGTHLTIIRNLTAESPRMPPAVDLITRQLKGTYLK